MKTLYININNEEILSNEELEVLNYDLDSDFFFHLGEKIAKGCKVENENALITDFYTQDTAEDYQKLIAQWNELKNILFSKEFEGEFEFSLSDSYIHWLRYSEKYNHVYDKNFSHGESPVISIDLEELYEESVEDMQRKILRTLKRNDLSLVINEIVFNDDAVTRKSSIVRAIKEKYEGFGFNSYKEWIEKNKQQEDNNIPDVGIPIDSKWLNKCWEVCLPSGFRFNMIKIETPSINDDYFISEKLVTFEMLTYLGVDIAIDYGTKYNKGISTKYHSNMLNNTQLPLERCPLDFVVAVLLKLRRISGLYFDLPTEKEWEFAAQGGVKSKGFKYSGSNIIDEVAWYQGNTNELKEVALKKANELGIYDMSGLVNEWCLNGFVNSQEKPIPINYFCLKGGCYKQHQSWMEISARGYIDEFRPWPIGIRLVIRRSLKQCHII